MLKLLKNFTIKKFLKLLPFTLLFLPFILSPISYAVQKGLKYEIINELFDSGGGRSTGTIYELHNATGGEPFQGKRNGSSSLYQLLEGHSYKDITLPEVQPFNWWRPDPNNPATVFVVRTSWKALDDNWNEFDTGIENPNGYDVDFAVSETDVDPNTIATWYNLYPRSSYNPAILEGADNVFGSITIENSGAILVVTPYNADLHIDTITGNLGIPLQSYFYFRMRALDESGNVASPVTSDTRFGNLWFQGVDGEVYATDNLISNISSFVGPTNPYFPAEAFLVSDSGSDFHKGGIVFSSNTSPSTGYGKSSERGIFNSDDIGWNVSTYGEAMSAPNYNWFLKNLEDVELVSVPDSNGDGVYNTSELLPCILIQSTNGLGKRFLTGGNLNIDASLNSIKNNHVVIFVDGNLTFSVDPQIDPSTSIVFIVSGEVIFNNSVTSVKALIIADGIIHTANTDVNTAALKVNGSLISGNDIDLKRKLGSQEKDLSQPSEQVQLDPMVYFSLGLNKETLGVSKVIWQEISE